MQKFFTVWFVVVTVFAGLGSGLAQAGTFSQTSAKQAIVMDYDTGMILLEKDADTKMPTSSMSKVITLYATFAALQKGTVSLDTMLPVSEKAWRKGGSKMFVKVGTDVSVEDLVRGVVVQSGNDATIVLAEGLAGTEEAFADTLNGIAKNLGMKNSHFMNASGWPDPDHYSTAHDLAILAAATIKDFPDYYHYFAEQEFTYNNIKQPNRNPLIYRNIGADGLKTGHTEVGGYGLMGAGTRNGRRVVFVLNGLASDTERAEEGARLLDWGLRSFENIVLFKAGETIDRASVVMGKSKQVPLTVENDIKVTLPVSVRNDLKVEMVYAAPLLAPINKGQKIGVLKIDVPRLQQFEVPLVAAEDIKKAGFFPGLFAKAGLLLSGGGDGNEPQ